MDSRAGARTSSGGRIEGGFDAVVIGAGIDGLAAAALLGKAGLKTILLGGGGAAVDDERREFAPGYFCIDGDHLLAHLDPTLIESLDLHRHGLSFAARRLETVYHFTDGGALLMPGDLYASREAVAAMAPDDVEAYAAFIENALEAARALRPFFDGGGVPALAGPVSALAERMLSGSVRDLVEAEFMHPNVQAFLAAEAALGSALRPGEPFAAGALLARWSGEAAGLQAASAFPVDGALGVKRALRRAAQAAGVDFRPSTGARRVLVEWDAAAGVETADGGQIRARIVISALPARESFFDLVGPALLDAGFESSFGGAPPAIASARVNFALTGAPKDAHAKANLGRRLVFAPDSDALIAAYAAARGGQPVAPLVLEALFPSEFDPSLAPDKGLVVSAVAHPAPFAAAPDPALSEAVAVAARATFERMAPGAAERIIAVDVRLPADDAAAAEIGAAALAARSSVVEAWGRARAVADASGLEGYFFCGPEADIAGLGGGGAGRRAAAAAIRHARVVRT